jgi:hypothetical protein
MPIKQPGEIGPKPIMANREKTAKDFSCAEFIVFNDYKGGYGLVFGFYDCFYCS